MREYIMVFDTETTGLPLHPSAPLEKQPRIIEFGAALLSSKDGSIVEEANILINPGNLPLDPVITKITGLTDDDLKDAPLIREVWPQIVALFAKSRGVIAHNLPFDRSLVKFEMARLDSGEFPWPARELCTVGAFQEVWGRRPKLVELYEWSIGKPLAQTHRALDDVHALVEIVQKEGVWRDLL